MIYSAMIFVYLFAAPLYSAEEGFAELNVLNAQLQALAEHMISSHSGVKDSILEYLENFSKNFRQRVF